MTFIVPNRLHYDRARPDAVCKPIGGMKPMFIPVLPVPPDDHLQNSFDATCRDHNQE
jgi:hypothetical protein